MSSDAGQSYSWVFGETSAGEAPPASPELGADPFAGRFRVDGRIGEGTQGEVLRGFDLALARPVAIKVLKAAVSETARARFLREGELTASLRHPNVVRVYGGGVTQDGRPYLILELIEDAVTLDRFLRPECAEGIQRLIETARAVGHAHAQGLVHRDLKPENVLVDGEGRLRVCDFGLAWQPGVERLTRTGHMIGTPWYMAPELYSSERGSPGGPEADVWSLGVMLYQALTGTHPFDEQHTLVGLMQAVSTSRPTPPSRQRPGVPLALSGVCLKALAAAPADRYAHGSAFAHALEEARDAGADRPGTLGRAGLVLAAVMVAVGLALVAVAFDGAQPPPGSPPQPSGEPARASSAPLEGEAEQGPPAEVLDLLRGAPSPARSLAAVDLLDGWPDHPQAVAAGRILAALRREPLVQFHQASPRGMRRKDWEVTFDPRRPHEVIGILDRVGTVARWDMRTGLRTSFRRSAQGWKFPRFGDGFAVVLEGYEANAGLWRLDLEGDADRWFLPRAERPAIRSFAMDPVGTVFVVLADGRLQRYGVDGVLQRTVELPGPAEGVQCASVERDRVVLLLGDAERELCRVYSATIRADGPAPWVERGEFAGASARLGAHSSGALALGSALGTLDVLLADGRRVSLRASRGPITPAGMAWSVDAHALLYLGRSPADDDAPTVLELWAPGKRDEPLASWATGVRCEGVKWSADERFAVLGFADDPSSSLAGEVWYVGRHAWLGAD